MVNIENTLSATCVTVPSNTGAQGAPMVVLPCDGRVSQSFQFWPVANVANTSYVSTSNGLCLVPNPAAQMLVTQFPCPAQADNRFFWRTIQVSPSVTLFENSAFGGCLAAVSDFSLPGIIGPGTVAVVPEECNPIDFREH
ncbi:ricin-type beta-trefoil lectin domain protein [Streptosporangiaceae bacterium NEAU-GS5]|nr:ricin-type beta-trefoil lectin domain protein [Streptosporangiaceae bacterium NEAU-GS5]